MSEQIYYYTTDGTNQIGPISKQELQAAGIGAHTQVWCNGMANWQPAGQVPALADIFPAGGPPPIQPPAPVVQQQNYAPQAQAPFNQNQTTINVGQGQKSNGAATASLVLSLIGLIILPWLLGLLGVIFGIVGLSKNKQEYGGRGAATAGLIIGIIDLAWGFVWVAVLANVMRF
jgi:hypothetical protein